MSDIQYVYPLIHNKVTSPHYVTPTLRRARLIDWLNDAAECRAVVIAADAGYGKTTLLWQWEREVEFPCYWYKLDRNDRDWSLHISYLIEAISQRHPGFGRRAHSMLQQLGGPGSSRPGVAAYLLAEMYERLTEPCTFIIDDWQFVASVTEVRGLWNQILRDAPPTCRFIFLSRAKPHLQFARFKTHGGYAEMRTDALRFTDREIGELFRDIYNDPLDPTELVELERRTEGWAASLQLVEVSLRERRTPEERRAFIQSITASRDSDLVEFLAEEVLDQQPEAIRNFLLSTSVLHQIDPDLAARLAGVRDGLQILADLESRGLFTYRLDSDEGRFRYHGLFRDFLERRLNAERSRGEVTALHIHAASYYETHEAWPQAIHHYLRAGLQPQAARLIAKFGEDLMSSGRMPLLDEWLGQLPRKTVQENARLSLLSGEVAGVRGSWDDAIAALHRAQAFFARKGDRRLEALACSKLSTVYNNLGDVERCVEAANEGLALAPDDAHATQIRLRGNVATTATWLKSLAEAVQECKRLGAESAARGFEQYAAIAHHNVGIMLRYAGRLEESASYLEKAARFWDASPTNPFADNAEYVQTLLLQGREALAASVAEGAVERTKPWPKPNGEARFGTACVLAYRGEFARAATVLREVLSDDQERLGPVGEKALSLLVECLYLGGTSSDEMRLLLGQLDSMSKDPRLAPTTTVALALGAHRVGACRGRCQSAKATLDSWERNGAALAALTGRVPLALLSLEHAGKAALTPLSDVVRDAVESPARGQLVWWLRRFAPHIGHILAVDEGPSVVAKLIAIDPEPWIHVVAPQLPALSGHNRSLLLRAIEEHGPASSVHVLRGVDGADIQELRRRLTHKFAAKVFVRSFGSLTILRGAWEATPVQIGRKRLRLLLGLLVARGDLGMSRDEAIDLMWPEADPLSAVNSLNQTVFQLRRLIEPDYREGDSPPYVMSTLELVQLNPDLVETDLQRARRLIDRLKEPQDQQSRVSNALALVDLIRGEFLADLRYEDWVLNSQLVVHAEIRTALLRIAEGDTLPLGHEATLRAGSALTKLDPYDESAHLAIAKHLASSGRRIQAREFLARFAKRLREDLDEEPSAELRLAAALVGVEVS